jgi:hypothetical protein
MSGLMALKECARRTARHARGLASGATDSLCAVLVTTNAPCVDGGSLQHGRCPEVSCGADRRVTKPVLKADGKLRTAFRLY